MGKPGSYMLDQSELFMQLGEQQVAARPQRVMPSLIIARQVNIEDRATLGPLRNYLDELGRENFGAARVKTAGSLAVSFVTAKEMGRMLGSRYSDMFAGGGKPRRILQTLRSLASEYHDFVRTNQTATIRINEMMDADGDETTTRREWMTTTFDIAKQPTYGERNKNGVALEFEPDSAAALAEETETTRRFLRDSKLDTRLIDKRQPHIEVLDAFYPIADVALKGALTPLDVSLTAPQAIISENKSQLLP